MRRGTSSDLIPPAHRLYLPKWAEVEFKLFHPLLDRMVGIHSLITIEYGMEKNSVLVQILSLLQYSVCRRLSPHIRNVSEKVAEYLKQSIRQPFRAEEMEKQLHFQYDYLSRCLKKYTGLTPVKYLQRLRIEEAKALLSGTDYSIGKVGEMVGIDDVSYFIRMFGELEGVSPGIFRKSKKGYL